MSRTTAGALALVFSVVGVVTWWIARESLNAPTAAPPTESSPGEVGPPSDGRRPSAAPEPRAGGTRPTAPASARTAPASGALEQRPAPSRREGDRLTLLLIDAVRDRPIPDAEVIVDETRHRADANGSLRLEFEPPLYLYVEVRAKGYCPTEFRLVDTTLEGTADLTAPIRLRVVPSAAIEGTVRDAAGIALVDRAVDVVWLGRPKPSREGDAEPRNVLVESRRTQRLPRTRSDANGGFRLDGIPAGAQLGVLVWSRSFRALPTRLAYPRKAIVLEPGETRHLDLITLPVGTVSGRVVDRQGEPVRNARVQASVRVPWFQGESTCSRAATTDAYGAFKIRGVPLGPGTLVAKPSSRDLEDGLGFGATEASFELQRHGEEVRQEIMVFRGLAVRGRVVSPDRAPLSGVRVETVGATELWFGKRRASTLGTFSRDDGTFTLKPVAPGPCRIIARGKGPYGNSCVVETKAGASDLVLRLCLASQIGGRVLDADTDEPVCGRVTVWPRSSKREARITDTDRQGRFRLDRVLPGLYDLVAVDHAGKKIGVRGRLELARGKACRGVAIPVRRAGALRIESEPHAVLDELRVESAGCTVFAESRFNAAIALPIPVPADKRVGVRAVVNAVGTSPERRFRASITVPAGQTVTVTLAAASESGR